MKISRSRLSVLSCITLAISGIFLILSAAPAVSAELLWNWSYKCSILTTQTKCDGGSGTFTTTDQQGSGGDQYYLVTGITGTVEKNTITSLVAPNSLGEDNDNKLSAPSGSPFANIGHKITGIAFLTNNDPPTDANVNLLFSNFIDDFVGYYTQISGPGNLALIDVDFSSKKVGEGTPVPEPSSFLLYITMVGLMLGTTLRKAFK